MSPLLSQSTHLVPRQQATDTQSWASLTPTQEHTLDTLGDVWHAGIQPARSEIGHRFDFVGIGQGKEFAHVELCFQRAGNALSTGQGSRSGVIGALEPSVGTKAREYKESAYDVSGPPTTTRTKNLPV